jgi:hypothetical protein
VYKRRAAALLPFCFCTAFGGSQKKKDRFPMNMVNVFGCTGPLHTRAQRRRDNNLHNYLGRLDAHIKEKDVCGISKPRVRRMLLVQ